MDAFFFHDVNWTDSICDSYVVSFFDIGIHIRSFITTQGHGIRTLKSAMHY